MSDETQELLRRQKAQCIFCKIIAGEVPSKTVYSDERMRAILDINPAAKGHTLVLPNEHYPVLPLIPPDEFAHLFGTAAALSRAVKEGAMTKHCTVFIANGPVAGQQSPHFLFHIIPREPNDGLNFTIPTGVQQRDLAPMLQKSLYSVMREHLQRTGRAELLQVGERVSDEEAARINERAAAQEAAAHSVSPQMAPHPPNHGQLAALIEANPEIQALIMNNPEKFASIIKEQPEFQQLFAGIDIKRLSDQLRRQAGLEPLPDTQPAAQGTPATQHDTPTAPPPTPQPADATDAAEETTDLKPARDMTLQELFAFIESKERLRDYILTAPEKLKALIPTNKRLAHFFSGADVDAIIQAYRAHAAKKTEGGAQ